MYLPNIRNYWVAVEGSETPMAKLSFAEFSASYEGKWRCLLVCVLEGKVVLPPLSY